MSEEFEFTAYVRKEGRITVTKTVRDAQSLEEGDLVRCHIRKVNKK